MFFGGTCVVLIAKPFASVYLGKNFFDSWCYVPLLVQGIVYFSLSDFFGAVYVAVKKNKNIAITTVVAAVVNLLLNFLLLPSIGVWAAAISTSASYFVITLFRMFDSRRFYRFEIPFLRFALNSLIFLGQVIFVSLDLLIYPVSAIALLLLLLVNRKELGKSIKMIGLIVRRFTKKKKNSAL
jgi:O-antigen/teichoic acid export membrane protein